MIRFMIMPANEEAVPICGPIYVHQPVPSFYHQVPCFARDCGPKLDRSAVGTHSDEGSLRTVRRQAPKALWINLRITYSFSASHIETKGLPNISFGDAVHTNRGWQACTFHSEDADVLENQSRSSARYGNGEN